MGLSVFKCCCLVLRHVWLPYDPMDCSPPGSSVHGILQARILQWVAISFSSGFSQPRDWTHVSCIGRWVFTTEPQGEPLSVFIGMGNFIGYWVGRIITTVLGKGRQFTGIGSLPTFFTFMVNFETVIVPVGVSFSLLMCYNECMLKLKV